MSKSTPYKLGANYEYRVRKKLEKAGNLVIRTPKSKGGFIGSSTLPIDLISVKNGVATLYSLKFGNHPHFSSEEIEELKKLKEFSGSQVILVKKQRGKPETLTPL